MKTSEENRDNPISLDRALWFWLRTNGFKREFDDRSGGARCVQYRKSIDGRRELVIQFWDDGQCRVSSEFRGCCDTAPTYFKTDAGMDKAIEYETFRMDSQWAVPGSLASEKV